MNDETRTVTHLVLCLIVPIIIGGSVLFGTVMGYTALNEMLTYRGWLGVFLIACGIALVGTDPGGAGSVHG